MKKIAIILIIVFSLAGASVAVIVKTSSYNNNNSKKEETTEPRKLIAKKNPKPKYASKATKNNGWNLVKGSKDEDNEIENISDEKNFDEDINGDSVFVDSEQAVNEDNSFSDKFFCLDEYFLYLSDIAFSYTDSDYIVEKYALCYIDEDNYPELMVCSGSSANDSVELFCYDGNINSLGEFGRLGYVDFIPKQNTIRAITFVYGDGFDYAIYNIKGSHLEERAVFTVSRSKAISGSGYDYYGNAFSDGNCDEAYQTYAQNNWETLGYNSQEAVYCSEFDMVVDNPDDVTVGYTGFRYLDLLGSWNGIDYSTGKEYVFVFRDDATVESISYYDGMNKEDGAFYFSEVDSRPFGDNGTFKFYKDQGVKAISNHSQDIIYDFHIEGNSLVCDDLVLEKVPNIESENLIGSWVNISDDRYYVDFYDDGRCFKNGEWLRYYVLSDHRIMIGSEQFATLKYRNNLSSLVIGEAEYRWEN